MNSDVYRLVSIADGKSDSASIVNVFAEMTSGRLKPDINLLNYYNEVPVSYGSTICSVDKDSVELLVHEHQALIMKNDNSTLIKSKHFHKGLAVHCYAAYVSVPKKTVILHNFAYAQIRAERREAVRVKVDGMIPVKFSYEEGEVNGSVVDISGTGISFQTTTPPGINSDQNGFISFAIMGTALAVPGTFIRSLANADRHIYIFQIKPDRISENVICKFIYQRQVEIIQEIKEGLVVE